MDHLERMGIVHRDLAARNVLIRAGKDGETVVKLSDFGLGKVLDDAAYYVSAEARALPVKWCAPETMTHRRFSSRSDVWSFGVTFWEVWSWGEEPYCDWEGKLLKNLSNGDRLHRPSGCPDDLWTSCATPCFAWEAAQRPTFEVLYGHLVAKQLELFGADDEGDSDSASVEASEATAYSAVQGYAVTE